jgi:hypothetical protein
METDPATATSCTVEKKNVTNYVTSKRETFRNRMCIFLKIMAKQETRFIPSAINPLLNSLLYRASD